MRFTATCSAGLEELIIAEIKEFGGNDISAGVGSVSWMGPLESGYRACLWSRFASRILLEIAVLEVANEEELYSQVKGVRWQEHLGHDSTFAIDCTLAKGAPFKHSKYTSLKVKDGIADYFRSITGERPNVRVVRPDVTLNVHADKKQTRLSVDLAGEALHRRGYRVEKGLAPLKETLAAAIVALSGWDGQSPLLDPLCGSATLLIEAAMMFGDVAPGLGRSYFGLVGWRGHDDALWRRLLSEATAREEAAYDRKWPELIGFDGSYQAVRHGRMNCENAGLGEKISIEQSELFALSSPTVPGFIICNPPYGERLSEKEVIKYLYRYMGRRFQSSFSDWQLGLFTSNPDLADMTGIAWRKKFQLYNGPLSCRLFVGSVDTQSTVMHHWDMASEWNRAEASDFSNRLRKNFKKISSWARKEAIECVRVFDRDMPEYNVTVDLYGKQIQIREHKASSSISENQASERFQTVLQGVRQVFGVGRSRIYIISSRLRKKKTGQRGVGKEKTRFIEVKEGNATFLVNLTDTVGSGLPHHHRSLRAMVGREAGGKRFLNLSGDTGAASVHAILGGAVRSTTLVRSGRFHRWAEMNYAINGISPERHTLVHADSLEWLQQSKETFDVIVVTLPHGSTSGDKPQNQDTRKRLAEIVRLSLSHLQENGLLLVSTSNKSFQLIDVLPPKYSCNDIGKKMTPKDIRYHAEQHRCWAVRLKQLD